MGDLREAVRDAGAALSALVPHAVSFGTDVVASIQGACEAIEPALAKEELVVAVTGEPSAKRAVLRTILGAEAIIGAKARKERTLRIRARGPFDYTAKKADGSVMRFARNVPDRDPLYRKSIDQAEERVRVAKASREALVAQVERTRQGVGAAENGIAAIDAETEAMGETFAGAWRAHRAAEARLTTIERAVPEVPEIFRTAPAWWAVWLWMMRWMMQSKWREPLALYAQNRAEATAAQARAKELESAAQGTESAREELKRRRAVESENLERAHAALAAVEVALADERGVADAEKHIDQLVRDQAKYAGERRGEFFADLHDFDATARGDEIGDIDVELPLDHPNAPPPGIVLVVSASVQDDADAYVVVKEGPAPARRDEVLRARLPCVGTIVLRAPIDITGALAPHAKDRTRVFAAKCALGLRTCIAGIAAARKTAEAEHEKRLASLESQRIPHPDEFRAKQIKKSELTIEKSADEILAAALERASNDLAKVRTDWSARIESASGRRSIEAVIDDINQRGKLHILELLEGVSELIAREMQSHGETIEKFALDEIQSSYRTQKRMRAESLAPVASEVTGEDLADGVASLVPIATARRNFRRKRWQATAGGVLAGALAGSAVHLWSGTGIGAVVGAIAFFLTPSSSMRREALARATAYHDEISRKVEGTLRARRGDLASGIRASLDEALDEALRRINDAITRLMNVEKNAIEAERATLAKLASTRGTIEDHDARLRTGLEPFTEG